MVKTAEILLVLLALVIVPVSFTHSSDTRGDPCDTYENCVGSSIVYIRSNPDGTFCRVDSFVIMPSLSLGPNTISDPLS